MPDIVQNLWRHKITICLVLIIVVLASMLVIRGKTESTNASSDKTKGTTTGSAPTSVSGTPASGDSRPIALVFADDNGEAGCDGCAAAAEHMLKQSKWNFNVILVGPDGEKLTPELLKSAALYVQPGGGNTVDDAYYELQSYGERHGYDFTALMRTYVENGGRYLGLCMGGYLAGSDPGFDLLQPGNSDEFITSRGASVTTDADTIIDVSWRGQPRQMYFQDGAFFTVPDESKATVLARYTNNEIAVMITNDGKGKVGVTGPHPEATADWYDSNNPPLIKPANLNADLANDLLDTLMK